MLKNKFRLLIATNNAGKLKEFGKLLADLPFELLSLRDFEQITEVEEKGATFAENAGLKACGYARQTGIWAVADDSGLEVAALGGAPGIYSARYAGRNANDAQRVARILAELNQTLDEERAARFVCAMAVADEKGDVQFSAEGCCDGKIAREPRGTNGFGYDPIFIPGGFERTFGELPDRIKQEISHRKHASVKIIRYLRDFIAV